MKVLVRILVVLALLFAVGIAVLVWVGIKVQQQHGVFGGQFGGPALPVENPDVPVPVLFDTDEERSDRVVFSSPRGFYDAPFVLQLSSPTDGSEIWYTTDGSIPLPDGEDGEPSGTRYTEPIPIQVGHRITAIAMEPERAMSKPVTHTYLFLDEILRQSAATAEANGWPLRPRNGKRMDYGMDPEIVNRHSAEEWREAFKQIPSISLVTKQDYLTHPDYGIYTNPAGSGKGWERQASFELIDPKGEDTVQAGAGLRIRGGFTRNPYFLKHSFRLFFRKQYGAGKLKHAMFDDEGADRFDKLDLRTAQNYSWAREGSRRIGAHNTFVREVFCRDSQRAMGEPYTRSRYYHLFLNGHYWGIYMTEERPEAAYAATYFDGEREDFDTLKCSNYLGGYVLEATDGDTDAWQAMWEAARQLAAHPTDERYARLTGLTPDLSRPSGEPALVDADNLINYMMVHFYAGNSDGPLSAFLGNGKSNNWFAVRNRNGLEGFRFFVHDAEHSLGAPQSQNDRTGPYNHRNQNRLEYSNPQWLHQDLMAHPHYRRRFGELARLHLTGQGALTTEKAVARFRARANQITHAIRAQSARWGDAERAKDPYLVEDWENRIEWVIEKVLADRTDILIDQLRQDGLYGE